VERPIPSMTEAAAAVIAVVAVEGFVACRCCITFVVALRCIDDGGRKASAPGAIRAAKSIVEENFIVVFCMWRFDDVATLSSLSLCATISAVIGM